MDTIRLQQYPPQASPPASSSHGFPIMAIAILGIIAIFLVLVTYYSFVTSCRFRWQHLIDSSLGRFSFRRARHHQDLFMAFSPSLEGHGLDEMMIREIPTFLYSRTEGEAEEGSLFKCVVCLNEFQDQDMLRLLPRCNHAFHLDCIDIWLQTNANCPLCRTSIISGDQVSLNMIVAPHSSPQDHQPFIISRVGSDEHFVMIQVTGEEGGGQLDASDSNRHLGHSRGHSSRKSERKLIGKLTSKKHRRVSIMGDECINVREKDDQFSVQPIRRSFSMDSAADRHVYLSVQGILRHNRQLSEVRSIGESSSRSQRSIFSFGQGRGSKNAVIPIDQS